MQQQGIGLLGGGEVTVVIITINAILYYNNYTFQNDETMKFSAIWMELKDIM